MKKIGMLAFFVALLALPAVAEVVDAGNTICPVGGEKVSGQDFVEVEGKKYGLCCPMCADKLKKNPEKYLTENAKASEDAGAMAMPEAAVVEEGVDEAVHQHE